MSLFYKYNVEKITGIKTNLSSEMIDRIDLWNSILQGKSPWYKEAKPCGIVEAVLGQLSNAIGEEVNVTSDNELLDEVMKRLNENSKELVQNAVALGSSVVRPVFSNNKLKYEIIKLGNYIPTAYDLDGTLCGCIITKKVEEDGKEFLLIEKHNYKNKTHTVETQLFLIVGSNGLKAVALDACSFTAGVTPVYSWENVEKPFIVEVRNRVTNKVDGSNVPCALWQNTENLIEDADKQYNRLNWELEGGQMRVFADLDLFRKAQGRNQDPNEQPTALTGSLSKLIVKINGNGTGEEKINNYAPTLRTAQQIEAYNEILRRCELAWNVGKGTLSNLETVAQTATQYTGGKKALYSLVDSLESELEEKYKHLAYVFAYMASAFLGVAFNDNLVINYNDTSRKDPEALRAAALSEVQNKIISPAEYRERIFGEDEETAAEKVPAQDASDDIGGFSFMRE